MKKESKWLLARVGGEGVGGVGPRLWEAGESLGSGGTG